MILKDNKILSSPGVLKDAEKYLVEQAMGDEILWLGRAATALIIAYKTICRLKGDIKNPEVILPSVSCATPSNTALMSGLTPRYADVDADTGLITLETIKKRYTSKTVAIVFIHLYGNTSNLDKIKKWCEKKKIFLIEDNAQSLGGVLENGKPCGSVGDFVVYSFNKTKILEAGGGALLTKSTEHNKALRWVCTNSLPVEKLNSDLNFQLSTSYRNLHHSLVALFRMRVPVDISNFFLSVRYMYEPLYFKTKLDAVKLAESFKHLDTILYERKEKAKIYSKHLSGVKCIKLLDGWQKSNCCWRFSFLLEDDENLTEFSEHIRREGFHLSNLYWPVNQFFRPADKCPGADYVGRRIINTWVDASVNHDWVKKCAVVIKKQLLVKNVGHESNR